jgi:hypothetical protein
MSIVNSIATRVADHLPKSVDARGHAVIDYLMLAGTLAAAAFLFRRNRAAGACAVIAAVTQGTNILLTDFPGGVFKSISFPMHGRLGLGIAAMVASMPKMMNFDKEPEARFFQLHSLAAISLIGMTDFTGTGRSSQVREIEQVPV